MAMINGNHLAARATYDHVKCDTTAWTGSSIVTFNPAIIKIDDTMFDTAFTLQLTNPPNGAVAVFLDGGLNVKFSKNSYLFDQTNWNMSQNGNIVTLPSIGDSTADINVNVAVDAPCEVYNGCTQVYTGSRTVHPPKTCAMWGDPHIITFANYQLPDPSIKSSDAKNFQDNDISKVTKQFSVPLLGTYYAIKSPHLVIQTMHFRCVGMAACIGAVGWQYGDSKVVVSIFDQTYTEANLETAKTLTEAKIALASNADYGITQTETGNANHYSFTLSDSSVIVVNVYTSGGLSSLDLIVTLPGGYYSTLEGGLCNRMDTTDTNQLDLPKGQHSTANTQDDVNAWGRAWKVDPEKSLFEGGVDTGNVSFPYSYIPSDGANIPPGGTWTTKCAGDTNPVPYPPPKHKAGNYSTFAPVSYTYNNNDLNPSYDIVQGVYGKYTIAKNSDYKAPSKDDIGNCENQCGSALSSSNCDAISPKSSSVYANACVSDCLGSGSYAFTDAHKGAYLSSCNAAANAYTYSSNAKVAAMGYGYQNSVKASCKADVNGNVCSGNAVSCSESVGCRCKDQFTGLNCEIDISTAPQVNAPSEAASKAGYTLVNNNGASGYVPQSGKASDNVYGKNNGKSSNGKVGYSSAAAPMPMRTNSLVAVVLAAFAAVLVL